MADKLANYSLQSVQIYSAWYQYCWYLYHSEFITIYFISASLKIANTKFVKATHLPLDLDEIVTTSSDLSKADNHRC